LPPALLRYRVSENLARDEFLRIGYGCAQLMADYSRSAGVELSQCRRVLDFGCGCGRTLRWLVRDFTAVEFHGVDVDADAIDWCTKHLPRARFARNRPDPPLPYPDRHFDAIYCLSVFTHLDEGAQDRWLEELSRILVPGGLLLISVHGERCLDASDLEGIAELKSAGLLHRRSRKLQGIVPDWYQTTWHSQAYVVSRLSARFDDVHYYDIPDGTQALVTARGRG